MEYAMATGTHWTERSIEDFVHRVSADFVVQLEKRIEDDEIKQKELAERLGVTRGAVSQTLNNPGNLELKTMVQYARALGMKLAIVAYDDDDPDNEKGPIISEIFSNCWENAGKPQDFFELADTKLSSCRWIVHSYPNLAHTDNGRRKHWCHSRRDCSRCRCSCG
jgi:transcriptional regulator with XRE-family HTH domain